MKEFNVTGTCIASKHYMVDISNKLDKIIELIEKINILPSIVQDSMGRQQLLQDFFRD